ncbi:HD domain-containing protein [Paraflavitalea speifideaquila]|uniref:HD domain-containing protein n=1 Tax=Paraflavitalea speifideaquila TaxID=3076558 RepID=UPI0028EE3F74|nr:HD domain-containing protein [Paraflavitalea speifideiaquila]
MDSQALLQETERFVTHFYATRVKPDFLFHNIDHTKDVVKAATLLANNYQLPENEKLAVLLAAWFHDTGYSSGIARWHEKRSKEVAVDFLQQHQVNGTIIEEVGDAIMATQWPQCPTNLLEQILCDADLFHLGTDQFDEKNKLLRKELNILYDKKLGKKNGVKRTFFFFSSTGISPTMRVRTCSLLKTGICRNYWPRMGMENHNSKKNNLPFSRRCL